MMPPIPTTIRKTATTDYIDGVLVPEGTLLQICVRTLWSIPALVDSSTHRSVRSTHGNMFGERTLRSEYSNSTPSPSALRKCLDSDLNDGSICPKHTILHTPIFPSFPDLIPVLERPWLLSK